MKIVTIFSVFISALATLSASAQTEPVKKETVKVWGNCGMCQAKIEKAAKTAGATAAKWNAETHLLEVSFYADKTSLKNIEEKIGSVGYDTKNITASSEAYNNLPGCCKYERKVAETAAKPKQEKSDIMSDVRFK
jgi:hypothetical protein